MSKIKQLSKSQFEITSSDYHIYVSKEKKKFLVDIFHAHISDKDEAYIESIDFDSLRDCKDYIQDNYELSSSLLEKISFN